MHYRLLPLMLLAATAGLAQLPESPQAPPTPNTFSFMQVQKVPISYFTGLPTIEIPLCEVPYRDQGIKMSLTYNASGFKPDQHASWVGTGWALRAGGMVTRQVNGLPDEYSFVYQDGVHPGNYSTYNLGWLKRSLGTPISYGVDFLSGGGYHWVDPRDFGPTPYQYVRYPWPLPYKGSFLGNSCKNIARIFRWNVSIQEDNTIYEGTKDVQSDEYSFSMFGYSGRFFFDQNNEPVVISDHKFKVTRLSTDVDIPSGLLQPNSDPQAGASCPQWILGMSPYDISNAYPKTTAGFTIQAEDGTTFYFGNHQPDQQAIEYSIGENYKPGQTGHGVQNYSDYWIANAWHLTSVRFPDGRNLYYDYERGDYQRTIYNSELLVSVVQNSTSPGCGDATSQPWPSPQITASKISSPVYLKRIYSDILEADFIYSNTNESNFLTANAVQTFKWKKLDTIQVKDYHGNTYRWAFTYDPLSNWSQRLFLQKVEKLDPANISTGERYLFYYNGNLTLPDYNQSKNDHWGFWNNAGTASIIGKSNGLIDTLRSPSLAYTSAGTLRKLVYPTGGYREFNYELNSYRKKVKYERMLGVDSLSSNFATGGLRIASIKTVDTLTGINNTIKYFYVSGFDPALNSTQLAGLPSSGVQNVNAYLYHWSNVIGTFYDGTYFPSCLKDLKFSLSCQQPLQSLHDDYHIGYSTVVEVRQDTAYTVRLFTNHDNGNTDDSVLQSINPFASPYRHFSSRKQERGKIKFEGLYTKSGKLIKSTETEYVAVPASSSGPQKSFVENWTNTLLDSYNGNGQLSGWETVPSAFIFSDRYKEYTYAFLPSKVTTRQYQDNANTYTTTVQETEYGNPGHWQATTLRHTNSNGKVLEQRTKFPLDFPTGVYVTERFTTNHWLNQPIEKINLFKDSATGPLKVTNAVLTEFALFPFYSAGMPVATNTWKLQLESPLLFSSMTSTAPVTYSVPSNGDWATAWTMDSRYKLAGSATQWDSVYNPLDGRLVNGQRTRTLMGYRGLLATGNTTIGNDKFWNASYTSFETMNVRDENDLILNVPDCNDWILIGSRDTTVAFTGKCSFTGRILMRQLPFITATIDIAVRSGGAIPILERYYDATGVYEEIPIEPELIATKEGWQVWRYRYSNAGIRLCINTNDNQVDELRMGAAVNFTQFNTITYVNGRQTDQTDGQYNRIHFEYDSIGRLIRIRDDLGNIVEEREFKFRTPIN